MRGAFITRSETSERTNNDWTSDPRLRQTRVVVFTASCTLVGTAHLMAQHRLLDELNTGCVASLHRLGEEFMPLTEVRIWYPTGSRDVALTSHVRKSSILFVAERSAAPPERNAAREVKGHLLRVRKPLCARAYLPPYLLEGKMHVGIWQELAQALDGQNRFLPMTDVTISPPAVIGESSYPFAAINKHQILHICELSEALQRLRQDVQRTLDAGQVQTPNLTTSTIHQ